MPNTRMGRLGNDHALTLLSAVYYLWGLVVGVLGFTPAAGTILDGWARVSYSGGMIAFSVLALLSTIVGARRAEATMLVCIGLITALNGVQVIANGSPVQTGLRIIMTALLALPFAIYRGQAVFFRRDVEQHIQAARDGTR